jgi:hypothetical protein
MQEPSYRPDCIPKEAERSYQGPHGQLLQAATDVCRRCHRSVSSHQVREFAHLPRAHAQAGRNAASKIIRPLEQRALAEWAHEAGLLMPTARFDGPWHAQGDLGEGENDVYFDKSVQRWFKRNRLTYHSTYLDFFYRVALHNTMFSEAPLRLEAFIWHPDETTDLDILMPIMSQPAVEGERAERDIVEPYMRVMGFTRLSNDDYYNATTGIRVEDLHNENVIMRVDGTLVIVDPVIYLDDAGKLGRLSAGDTLSGALAGTEGITPAIFTTLLESIPRPNPYTMSKTTKRFKKCMAALPLAMQIRASEAFKK